MAIKDGIFLIDKPVGCSSFSIVNKARHILSTKKIGHCGTLDPFASGLLILCVNEATKVVRFIEDEKKKYIAKLKLGFKTDTLDKTGKIVDQKKVPLLLKDNIENVFKSFLGKQKQVPPMYSALKYNGKNLYEYARDGISIDIDKTREIEIYSLDLISFDNNSIIFECVVSKGTYIRTLGNDIAIKLNTFGYLEELRRETIGSFNVKDAIDIEDISFKNIISLENSLNMFKHYCVPSSLDNDLIYGHPLKLDFAENIVVLHNSKGVLLGIYEKNENGMYNCLRGFNR